MPWKKQLQEQAARAFDPGIGRNGEAERALIDRGEVLSIRRQCVLLGVARSNVYRKPRPANDNDLNRPAPM